MFKKAQIDMRELVITLIVVGVISIVGVLIFAQVKKTGDALLPADIAIQTNETIAFQINADTTNSTLLSKDRFIENSEFVANKTDVTKRAVRNVDYTITLKAASGTIGTVANFTWIDNAYNFSNTTGVFITYNYNLESASQASMNNVSDTVLDSYSLGIIALIVLAAIVILGVLFKLGTQ